MISYIALSVKWEGVHNIMYMDNHQIGEYGPKETFISLVHMPKMTIYQVNNNMTILEQYHMRWSILSLYQCCCDSVENAIMIINRSRCRKWLLIRNVFHSHTHM